MRITPKIAYDPGDKSAILLKPNRCHDLHEASQVYSFWAMSTLQNTIMKRQRTEFKEDECTPESTALSVLLSSDKAMVVVGFQGSDPYIRLINDSARELLSHFWRNMDSEILGICEGHSKRTKRNLTAKKIKWRQPFDLSTTANAIEEDLIGRMLGMFKVNVSLIKMVERGKHEYITANKNVANIFNLPEAYQLRGRKSDTLGCFESDSASIYDQFRDFNNSENKTATFYMELEQFPNLTFFTSSREVMPGIFLCLCIEHDRLTFPEPRPHRPPKLNRISRVSSPKVWSRIRWDQFMEECILHLNHNRQHASNTRIKLPDHFMDNTENVFCYAYASDQPFLPAGHGDGHTWKSSRGIVCAGNLQRKYHYTELPDGRKLRRRVMWLEDVKGLWMVEYRHFENNCNTEASHLMGTELLDWNFLTSEIYTQSTSKLDNEMEQMTQSSLFQMAETRTPQMGSENVTSYVNSILHNWASVYGM
ncbi:hypothetical protein PROFUN_12111 [Planoprotostelium fungivorum]|uniref:Uncharacterized protein n=1 Tax=Planoprotostelium fungivorum TaxID=1890364 RepID=A0A2P6N8G2_9EUKA|nr:hypothetical protein PROFUN_12111 [Planoprotostelium fungivorum]